MTKIIFEEPDGNEKSVEIANGLTIMEGAVRNMVAGIDADCGGTCSCATCMVYVADDWQDRLPVKERSEESMLEFCPHVEPSSRLSCQITVTDALDGLRLKVPDSQR